ncbi:Uncharacterised protein [Candidatus Gugararchaeum adminiculabundum]|nr:Uncharacterised protein [Candidatus Gugararchaeum adminiculabundum]
MPTHETLNLSTKKVVKWGPGLVVFINKEAKMLGWDEKTKITVELAKDKKGEAIVVRKI